jgi:hypothetical protein
MCFSAEASFYSSALLTIVGFIAKVKNLRPSYNMLALTPIFFAVQQLSEGILWTCLGDKNSISCSQVFTAIFIFFRECFLANLDSSITA